MRDFDNICREYDKSPEIVERDLFVLLKFPEVSIKAEDIVDDSYYMSLKLYLDHNGYIIRESQKGYKRTARGEVAKAKGYVHLKIEDYKKQNSKKLIQDYLLIISAIASVVAAIAGVLSLFI